MPNHFPPFSPQAVVDEVRAPTSFELDVQQTLLEDDLQSCSAFAPWPPFTHPHTAALLRESATQAESPPIDSLLAAIRRLQFAENMADEAHRLRTAALADLEAIASSEPLMPDKMPAEETLLHSPFDERVRLLRDKEVRDAWTNLDKSIPRPPVVDPQTTTHLRRLNAAMDYYDRNSCRHTQPTTARMIAAFYGVSYAALLQALGPDRRSPPHGLTTSTVTSPVNLLPDESDASDDSTDEEPPPLVPPLVPRRTATDVRPAWRRNLIDAPRTRPLQRAPRPALPPPIPARQPRRPVSTRPRAPFVTAHFPDTRERLFSGLALPTPLLADPTPYVDRFRPISPAPPPIPPAPTDDSITAYVRLMADFQAASRRPTSNGVVDRAPPRRRHRHN